VWAAAGWLRDALADLPSSVGLLRRDDSDGGGDRDLPPHCHLMRMRVLEA
jgi:hypothetical protein